MYLTVHPRYAHLRVELQELLAEFEAHGVVLYDKRNQVRCFDVADEKFVIKRFKRLSLWRAVMYRFFRRNKALRAYDNALRLLQLGISTPDPVAWASEGRFYFYICMYTSDASVKEELVQRNPVRQEMVRPYALFIAQLHRLGVLHRDFNPSNVLFKEGEDGSFSFSLIDINRMRFYGEGGVPKNACMRNLSTIFWEPDGVFLEVLDCYASVRGWSAEDVAEAVRRKIHSNKVYARRKHWAHPIKFLRKKIKGH